MKTSTPARPRKASIAAEPVSPLVAPTMVSRRPDRFRLASKSCADQLHRHVLEGERRPVEELEQPVVRPDLHQRHPRGVAKPA